MFSVAPTGSELVSEDCRPQVTLPGGGVEISQVAEQLGNLLGRQETHFLRGEEVVRFISAQGKPLVSTVKAVELASDFEQVARFQRKGAKGLEPCICSAETASLVLHSRRFKDALPRLTQISACPVLSEQDGSLRMISGYDRATGIYACGDAPAPVPLKQAIALVKSVLDDFKFTTPGDRSRALAAVLTPALVMGGLLQGRAAIDVGEADLSQAGKGYRNKITTAIYGQTARIVNYGKGLDAAFQKAAMDGETFICVDNVRGKVDSQALESFMTEDNITCRAAYTAEVAVDPRRIVVMMTSNKADFTDDLSNRASIVCLQKQGPGHRFRKYPDGDIVSHIRARQAEYLGAVFSIIRAWYDKGKPTTNEGRHDFRNWCQTLDWIIQNILHESPLMAGHREIQSRVTKPHFNWLRDAILALAEQRWIGEPLLAADILDVLLEKGLEIPGNVSGDVVEETDRSRALQGIGKRLSSVFGDQSTVEIDGYSFMQEHYRDNQSRERRRYVLVSSNSAIPAGKPADQEFRLDPWNQSPNHPTNRPLVSPLVKPLVSPNPTDSDEHFAPAVPPIQGSYGVRGLGFIRGTSGDQGDQREVVHV